ncbi:transposase [Streptomyces sp. TRM66268-LWL]|uniref:Transposase n=1 Tax=Streptomyces polyasparticus TaxID=2767826 RepID=A0ABR7SVT7_9ACTN|nr:transposase [Streptomyces polyasparticus]
MGVADVLMLVCDGLHDTVETVWPRTVVQTCIVYLIRNSTARAPARSAARSHVISRPSAPHRARPPRLSGFWSSPRSRGKYPAVIELWSDAWTEMVPF